MRAALGLDQPFLHPFRALASSVLRQRAAESPAGLDRPRIRRRAPHARALLGDAQPVVDLIVQRLPQTLWVVGLAYLFGVCSPFRSACFPPIASIRGSIRSALSSRWSAIRADLFHRRRADRRVQREAAMVPVRLRHQSEGRRLVELPCPAPADVAASAGADALQHLADQPLRPRLHARQSASGLCAHRARQGRQGARRRAVHVLRNSLIPVVTVIALGVPRSFPARSSPSRCFASTASVNC